MIHLRKTLALSLGLLVGVAVVPLRGEEDPAAAVRSMVADLTEFLAPDGWNPDDDLAPGAFGAWDKPVPGEPLRRLTLTPMDLTDDPAGMARDVAAQIRAELVGEPEVALSRLVRELRFALRMPDEQIAVFWMRGVELGEGMPVVLLSTLDLDEVAPDELHDRADAYTPDLLPAYDWFTNRVVARALVADDEDEQAFELLGRRHRIAAPPGWSPVEAEGALRRWRGPHGATAELRAELADSSFASPGAGAGRKLASAAAKLAEAVAGELEQPLPSAEFDFPGVPRGGHTAGRLVVDGGLALVLEVVAAELPEDARSAAAKWTEAAAILEAWTQE